MPSRSKKNRGQPKSIQAKAPIRNAFIRNAFEVLSLDDGNVEHGLDGNTQDEELNQDERCCGALVADRGVRVNQDGVSDGGVKKTRVKDHDFTTDQDRAVIQEAAVREDPHLAAPRLPEIEHSKDVPQISPSQSDKATVQETAVPGIPDLSGRRLPQLLNVQLPTTKAGKPVAQITTPQQDSNLPSTLLLLPGELKNKIWYFAVMLPISRHPPEVPGPPSFQGTTHLLRLNRQIHHEVDHLLRDKPNRVTLNVWQPIIYRHQPLLSACKTQCSSWAGRAYTHLQVSRMNDLTIRIPYFEWRYPPEHQIEGVFDDQVMSRLGFIQEAGYRQIDEIQRQLYIVAAAASHNPTLKKLTLAFRRWKGKGGRDDADPKHWRYQDLHRLLEPLVRFRGTDFEIRAVSYELPCHGDEDQGRVEALAPWFNLQRADWVRQVADKEAGFQSVDTVAANRKSKKKKNKQSSDWEIPSEVARLENYLKPTTVTEFDKYVPEDILEHGKSSHRYGCGVGFGMGSASYCVLCHLDYGWQSEEPGRSRLHGEDGSEWVGPCAKAEDGEHDSGKRAIIEEEW